MAEQQQNALALIRKDTVDVVAAKVREFVERRELVLPPGYAVGNALKAAWLVLQSTVDKDQRPALQVCTRESVANALLDMVIQGLNPVKRQCYFIVYGKTLVCQRSYFGDLELVKRVRPDAEVYYQVVYQGDEFEYEIRRGQVYVSKHVQRVENIDPSKIVAAYCVVEDGQGRVISSALMTFDQIKRSWAQSRTYREAGGTTPHHTFPDQMALRTVIRRACKPVINSSTDDYLFLESVNRTDELAAEAAFEAQVAADANGEVIDATPEPVGGNASAPSEPEPAAAEATHAPKAQPEQAPPPPTQLRQQTLEVEPAAAPF